MVQSLTPARPRDPVARIALFAMVFLVAYIASMQPAPQAAATAPVVIVATPQLPTALPVPTTMPAPVVLPPPVVQPTEPPPPPPVVVEAPPVVQPAVVEAAPTPAPPADEPPPTGGKAAPDRAAHYYAATGEKPAPPEAQR